MLQLAGLVEGGEGFEGVAHLVCVRQMGGRAVRGAGRRTEHPSHDFTRPNHPNSWEASSWKLAAQIAALLDGLACMEKQVLSNRITVNTENHNALSRGPWAFDVASRCIQCLFLRASYVDQFS